MIYKTLIPTHRNSYSKPVHYNSNYPFITIDRDIDQFFNQLGTGFFKNDPFDFHTISEKNHFPKVDVTETENEFLISAELPGMDDKDIDVILDDGTLTLKGEKKVEREDQQSEFFSRERLYGSFQRTFKVPEIIDRDKINASFNKGILTVKLPKTPELKKEVKKIPINS